jgi:hypothetical protein
VEGPPGLEPGTRGLKGLCSNQLSYGPAFAGKITPYIICYLPEMSIWLLVLFGVAMLKAAGPYQQQAD